MVIPRLLDEVVEGLKVRPEVEAVLLGSSQYEGGAPDVDSDWDLYVYLISPLHVEVRRNLLMPRSTLLEVGNLFGEPEDDGELNDGTAFKLIYRDLDEVASGLSRVVEKAEALVGYTTCLWHNFINSRVLFDRSGRVSRVKANYTVPYPEALKKSIVAKNWPLLNKALPNFKDQVVLALKRGDLNAVQHRTTAFLASSFDLVFAANGRTHPGEKLLVQRSSVLPALPSDWVNLLSAVDRASQGSKTALPAALNDVAASMEAFLIRQGLLEVPAEKPATAAEKIRPGFPQPETGGLTVYTDGGCVGNPGKGAWAYLIDAGGSRDEKTNGDPLTTNNKMELQAVIEALKAIDANSQWKDRPIRIHTDSQYVRNGITAWIKTWSANGWKTAAKEPVKNQDLWMELQKWDKLLKPEWKWVKGHAGNPNNERCDALVRRTMEQM
jgi:ribonuclease HI